MKTAALIFADSYDVELEKLTSRRTLAAVPFGGRFRVIDFTLSNLVNAGIRNVGVVMTQRYDSLMKHVQSGSAWDLSRKQSGLVYLPPYAFDGASNAYENRLEAMIANLTFIRELSEDYLILTSCNYIANINLEKMIEYHIESGATITGLYTRDPQNKQGSIDATEYCVDDEGHITDVQIHTGHIDGMVTAANTYVINRDYLIDKLEEAARSHKKSFRMDVLAPALQEGKIMGYEAEGTMLFLDTVSGYMQSNFALLDNDIRRELLHHSHQPVITKVTDSAPARFGKKANVTNSVIADGSIIEGEVRNSIIFRGVHIKKNAVVENCIIMQDTTVGEGAQLRYAVLDKNAIINDGRMLSGYITHPFYVETRTVI